MPRGWHCARESLCRHGELHSERRFVFSSESVHGILGRAVEEVIGYGFETFIHEADREVFAAALQGLDEHGRVRAQIQDAGPAPHVNQVTSTSYDGQGRPSVTTLPEGNSVAVTYDNLSNPLTVTRTAKPTSGSSAPTGR